MWEHWSIDFMRRMHAFMTVRSSCILNEGNVIAKLHAKATCGFDTGICYHADQNYFLYSTLIELCVKIGIGKAALCPVFKHDYITFARSEFRMELTTPSSSSETPDLV